MKIAICSDLHLEFGAIDLENTENADVLILSGDICVSKDVIMDVTCYGHGVGTRSQRIHDFFQEVTGRFKDVIYVMGNHEHYHGDYAKSYENLKEHLGYLKNLHILEKESLNIGDVTFIGGTLWTDMNGEDPETLYQIKRMMNDFHCVKNSNRLVWNNVNVYETDENGKAVLDAVGNWIKTGMKKHSAPSTFCPEDAVVDHKQMLEYIRKVVEENPNGNFVVVGHHCPSRQSTHPRYANDTLMNGGYSSHLDFFLEDHPQIKLWTHGHTHEPFDYNIGLTRVVCNPRGYIGHEIRADEFELKFVDV